MRQRNFLTIFLLLSFVISSAQITNVRKWRKSEVDSLDHGLFLFDEQMYLNAAPIFENILKNHPKEEFIKYTFAKCALYRSDKHEEAYLIFTELYRKYMDLPDMNYDLAQAALYILKFDEADEYIDKYLKNKKISLQDKRRADHLKQNIQYARFYIPNPTNAKITNLGTNVNTPGDEYVPAITADESKLIFTYLGDKSIGGMQNENQQPDPKGFFSEDIYQSVKVDGEFQKAVLIDSLNTNLPDACISMSIDGSILFMYQDLDDGHGDIYKCELEGEIYSKPKKMKGLNSYSWDGHCSLSPNGKTIYFSSERVGGYGGRDIYRAELLPDSTWGDIVNLGDSINTRYDDDSPFIHADGKTLFFSSEGHSSMGGYDIFKAIYNPNDSTFGHAENLGSPINSTDDDIYFVLAANGQTGYYSSGRKGGIGLKDIYKVETNFTTPVSSLYLVEGTVKNDNVPVAATIKIQDLTNNNEYARLRSNSSTGFYLATMPTGAKYKVEFLYKGKSQFVMLDGLSLSGFAQSTVNIDFNVKTDTLVPVVAPVVVASNAMPTVAPVANSETTVALAADPSPEPVVPIAAKTKTVSPPKDSFIAKTKYQEKTMRYVEKYGDVRVEGLEFKVQFSAFKSGKNFSFPKLTKLGQIDRWIVGDGYTRLTIGGSFKTLRAAWGMNKKVVNAGETETFIVSFYNGKRTTFEELEKNKVFVEK